MNGWFQILLFLLLVFLVTKPLGIFMARVFNREKTFMDPVLRPIERLLYRVLLTVRAACMVSGYMYTM